MSRKPRTIARWAYAAANDAAARVRRLEASGALPDSPEYCHAWDQMVEVRAIAREAFHVAARGALASSLPDAPTDTTQLFTVFLAAHTGGVS